MGAIISALAAFLGSSLTAIVGWAAAALTSQALAKFWTFAAKVAFLYLLNAVILAALQPLASALAQQSFSVFPQLTLWLMEQIDWAFTMSTIMSAFVVSYGVKLTARLLG